MAYLPLILLGAVLVWFYALGHVVVARDRRDLEAQMRRKHRKQGL